MVKPNRKIQDTSILLVLQKVLRETETAVTRLLGRQFLLKSRQIPWWIYDGVYFTQSCSCELINNFTKNQHYPKSGLRVLPLRVQIKVLKISKTTFDHFF